MSVRNTDDNRKLFGYIGVIMNLHIYSAVNGYKKLRPKRFHMPGHKGKNVLKLDFSDDVTELFVIDNETAVKKAEEDIEKIYGAKKVRFLSDGATSGILSAIYAVSDLSEKIIINRDAHKSVYNALTIFKKSPVITGKIYSDVSSFPVTIKDIESAVEKNPDVKVVCLTYPDYYGRVFDIESISAFLKKRGITLIIDGAHGGFIKYTRPEIYAGKYADIVIESAHKTFPTLNQGAAIFCYNDKLNKKVEEGVSIFSTTSPSYPILSSVEYGFKYFHENTDKVNKKKAEILKLKEELISHGVDVLTSEDDFKLTVLFYGFGIEAEKALEKEGIFSELYNKNQILFMLSPFNSKKDINKLKKAIIKIYSSFPKNKEVKEEIVSTRQIDYITAKCSEYEEIDISDAEGRISAENAGLFPPCSPIITAGEIIDGRIIKLLKEEKNVFGIKDGKIRVLKRK